MSLKFAPQSWKTSLLVGPETDESTGEGGSTASSHLETWCEALSSFLVFWAALRAKPDVLTYHAILQTVFKISRARIAAWIWARRKPNTRMTFSIRQIRNSGHDRSVQKMKSLEGLATKSWRLNRSFSAVSTLIFTTKYKKWEKLFTRLQEQVLRNLQTSSGEGQIWEISRPKNMAVLQHAYSSIVGYNTI